jgi:hypothetical protein
MGLHCLLSLDHAVDGGGLGDLPLDARLLDQDEVGRVCVPATVVAVSHEL